MSSVLRTDVGIAKPFTKFTSIKSMAYYDENLEQDVLIPFSYNNGVLDIAIQDDSLTMINAGNATGYNDYNDGGQSRMVKLMGGEGRVTSLGSNFLTWISEYLITHGYGALIGTPTLYVAPVMTRVQQCVTTSGDAPLNNAYALQISYEKPNSDEYILAGNEENNFFSVWVFKTPITVQFNDDGDIRYATLTSQFTSVW